MTTYRRFGPFLLGEALATAPWGQIHRAISTTGARFQRHHRLLTFSEEVLGAGLAASWPKAREIAQELGAKRGFGEDYQLGGPPLYVSCDDLPGRCLAQVLAKAKAEQIPFGVDQALAVLQGVAQAILAMDEQRLHHGALSPHSVWISDEGAVQILDAPVATALQALLPRAPVLRAALEPYRPAAPAKGLPLDLFAMGAMLYELLTLDPLPTGPAGLDALAQATLKAAQEDAPVPEDLLNLMKRLLMVEAPFATAAEFNRALEQVLFGGDYGPTTFNLAFLMRTLFREEQEAEALARNADRAASYAQEVPAPAKGRGRFLLLAGGAVLAAGVLGALLYSNHQSVQRFQLEQRSMEAKLAAFQRAKEANDAKLAEITKEEERQKVLEALFGKQVQEAPTEAVRTAAKKDLADTKQAARKLAMERAEAMYISRQLAAKRNGAELPAAKP